MIHEPTTGNVYFPPPESRGGWRCAAETGDLLSEAGVNPDRLDLVLDQQQLVHGGESWSVVIIHKGLLVREFHTFNVLIPTRFDLWSTTKSFVGTAWGLLFDDSRSGLLPDGQRVDLDSRVYDYIPGGDPLSDPRKKDITFRHLLSMTSGIAGVKEGIVGIPTTTGTGPFEHSFGMAPNRFGQDVGTLVGDPGTLWDYSDPAMAHLAVAFANITGREMTEYLQERVFGPIGIEQLSWDVQGGSGSIGPHTNAHTGIHLSARELSRFGYLMLHKGLWDGQHLVPSQWVDVSTKTSQTMNPNYGYTWWVNTQGTLWPELPQDAFAALGYRSNGCYIVPSLDLVVARVGTGPATWDDRDLIQGIAGALQRD